MKPAEVVIWLGGDNGMQFTIHERDVGPIGKALQDPNRVINIPQPNGSGYTLLPVRHITRIDVDP